MYRERLSVPIAWWLLGTFLAASVFLAVGWYLGLSWGLAAGLCSLAIVGAIFASASVAITLDSRELAVGRARIELTYVAGAIPLDKSAADRRTGPDADARAFLVVRPYIPGAVEITLDDPDDPVPYWLVSSRHPDRLASAISAAIGTRGGLH
jgi:Protein of unknown function (DUF3093)